VKAISGTEKEASVSLVFQIIDVAIIDFYGINQPAGILSKDRISGRDSRVGVS
jgi:hypothetical protein